MYVFPIVKKCKNISETQKNSLLSFYRYSLSELRLFEVFHAGTPSSHRSEVFRGLSLEYTVLEAVANYSMLLVFLIFSIHVVVSNLLSIVVNFNFVVCCM